ncbi:MAG: response regulator [Acidobacteriota bacterium]
MSKRKLLLADDSVTIQKVVNLTFADEGIEVIAVGDGDSAMEKVAEISPDLIMADVNMPGLTGYEICERIRQDEKLSKTPVILLVGSFEPFDEDEARRVGADDYLTKPFQSIRQLVNKVTALLQAHTTENGDGVVLKDSSSLEDTLEMDVENITAPTQSAQFDDGGYDDEMIQTNRPSSFAFDETQRFESRETGELSKPPEFENKITEVEERTEVLSNITNEELIRISDEDEETLSTKIEAEEDYSYQSAETVSPEIETPQDVSYEIKDEENTYEIKDEESVSYEIKDEETVYEAVKDDEENTSEIKDEESANSEIERNDYSYQIESNSGVSYEIKDEISEEVLDQEEVLDELQSTEEASEEITEQDEVSEQIQETEEVLDEVLEQEEISDEATEVETVSEDLAEIEETSSEIVAEEIKDEEDILEDVEEDVPVSAQVKDYQFVSEDDEELIPTAESTYAEEIEEKTDSDEIKDEVNLATESEETETELEEVTEDNSENESVGLVNKTPEDEMPLPEFASVLEFDDDDILQLPPIETNSEVETNSENATTSASAENVGFVATPANTTIIDSSNISAELIDMIVAKVLERLSDKAIKEVAWEVVPQMTELIVKKMAEEKLKE